jgi:adenine-specific DNA-methyltransferase
MKEVIRRKLVIWPDDFPERKLKRPRYKTYYDPSKPKMDPVSSWIESGTGLSREAESESDIDEAEENGEPRVILHSNLNVEGGRILRRIFGKKVMAYPKPLSLMKSICKLAAGKDDIILDSFAGSGTTAHAALGINAEDGGARRFIMVQMAHDTKQQEKDGVNICKELTSERIRRVINGYTYSKASGKKEKVPGLGGSFTYARLGPALFGEYRDLGEKLPAYEELAKYIFYTETSREFDKGDFDKKSGKIGEHAGASYYLLYTPNSKDDRALNLEWLKAAPKSDKNKRLVVYCEKLWVHRDDLAKFEKESGKSVRPMLVPFSLR